MFESAAAAQVREWTATIAGGLDAVTDEERLAMIRGLEELKCAAAAAQAVLATEFDQSQRRKQREQGVPAAQLGRGVASELAFARRESPHRAQQQLGLGKILVTEMPHTMAAFRAGTITEWAATVLVRETACLDLVDRRIVDERLASDAGRLERMGVRELEAAAQKLAYQLDPGSFVARRARADSDRRVTLRPAPDTMALLSALTPAAQGVAMYAALTGEADRLRATGDPRSRGQIMADTLVERVTGQASAPAVPVTIDVVISDAALLAASEAPAWLDGYGPVPAEVARRLVTHPDARVEVRRLYARPETGELVAMESGSRCFRGPLATMIELRDQICRTPWCGAPIRHTDHALGTDDGGPTSYLNGQGLCEACNYAKQAPGWLARPGPDGDIVTRTPTGLVHTTAPPGVPPPAAPGSRAELYLSDLVLVV
ncbi:HNH endonuclease [Nocardioides cynanchi]|uniref:HNH endonuclease n=1 Tax=Nocardioides cynanchi TaxID=2558918 RepID=UPI00192D25B6|nr:DUF222 domain-containing protein [Nocardioides cynanchi]